MRRMKWPFKCVGFWDIDARVQRVWAKSPSGVARAAMHLGPTEGNLMNMKLKDLPDAEAVIAGPPCPPWSSMGLRRALKDKRATVFKRIIKWCVHLATRGTLQFFVLENVVGITHKKNGRSSLAGLLRMLRRCTGFKIVAWKMNSRDYGVAQNRPRVYIVGVRKSHMCRALVKPVARAAAPPLKRFLSRGTSVAGAAALTLKQRRNLRSYLKFLLPQRKNKNLKGTYAVVRVDRKIDGGFRQNRVDDLIPTLTTSNRYLWIVSLGDGLRRPVTSRLLRVQERAALQGFHRWREMCGESCISDSAAIFLLGNAMTVPVVGHVLNAIASSLSSA